jgi:hypothetical protein
MFAHVHLGWLFLAGLTCLTLGTSLGFLIMSLLCMAKQGDKQLGVEG